jgi:hypothetical protein
MLDFVVKEKKLQQCEVICENLEATWKELKYGKGKDHYYARHIVAIAIIYTQNSSSTQVARNYVRLNYRSIQQAMEHRELLNNENVGVKWVKYDRKQWSDAISESVKQIVVRWWTKETRVSPNVKDWFTTWFFQIHGRNMLLIFCKKTKYVFLSSTQILFCKFLYFHFNFVTNFLLFNSILLFLVALIHNQDFKHTCSLRL